MCTQYVYYVCIAQKALVKILNIDVFQKGGLHMALSAGDKMRTLRGNKSQEQVAEALGIPVSTYASYEQGARIPRDSMKRKIADYYNRTVQFIFFSK